ncbi:putative lipase [Actinomadura rupiterrae]|uniref:putative lipase n=1 Tax=Actinomadura rupiterrae TaxID=559627 RepID=UPI0020A3F320|nr:putative lipase [Actinomadura rupiterrae]MCP2338483.1 triacylglycerol esterase/lipase EstA (alpha/beta hydrolase family) [Actinomadura rupiterrae]
MRRILRAAALPAVAFSLCAAQAAPALAASGPPAAPRTRAADTATASSDPVYLVHGLQLRGGTDCAATWKQANAVLRSSGFTGPLVTWGYYSHDTHCTRHESGTLNTPVLELGRRLAWDVYQRYSRHGVPVRVVGHSMGGLVAATALAGVKARPHGSGSWPPYLLVKDVVTLSAPFRGIAGSCSSSYRQCRDLKPGSALQLWLARQSLQGRGGTDWTLVSAAEDTRVPYRSALAAAAKHKVEYLSGQGITHYNLHRLDSGHSWRIRYSDNGGASYKTTRRGPSPLRYTAVALASSSH